MRFQIFILSGLAFTYAAGAYYGTHEPTTLSNATLHQGVSNNTLRDGDVLFQTSNSSQSKAIQLATHSKYSHCGILFFENGKPYVYKAVQPVTKTPLENWTAGHYVAKRLKNADDVLSTKALERMKAEVKKFYGKDYDVYFDWDDDEIYCSELVYKVYERGAGVKVGELKKLKDYDLTNTLVQQQLKQRYGSDIPYDEQMISPGAIFDSEMLRTVASN